MRLKGITSKNLTTNHCFPFAADEIKPKKDHGTKSAPGAGPVTVKGLDTRKFTNLFYLL